MARMDASKGGQSSFRLMCQLLALQPCFSCKASPNLAMTAVVCNNCHDSEQEASDMHQNSKSWASNACCCQKGPRLQWLGIGGLAMSLEMKASPTDSVKARRGQLPFVRLRRGEIRFCQTKERSVFAFCQAKERSDCANSKIPRAY